MWGWVTRFDFLWAVKDSGQESLCHVESDNALLCAALRQQRCWRVGGIRYRDGAVEQYHADVVLLIDPVTGLQIRAVIGPDMPALRRHDLPRIRQSADGNGQRVDIVTRSSNSSFNAKDQLPASNTNALGQSESVQYDRRLAAPTASSLELLWRPSRHSGPNDGVHHGSLHLLAFLPGALKSAPTGLANPWASNLFDWTEIKCSQYGK
jgi:hypothetical protein